MPRKKVLLSTLKNDQTLTRQIGGELHTAGLDVLTHVWDSDLTRHAWHQAAEALLETGAWIVAGDLAAAGVDVRKSLALTALEVQGVLGYGFPIFLTSCGALDTAALPGPLQVAQVVNKMLGVKCAVQAQSLKRVGAEYRLKALVLPGNLGLWFEIGPALETWKGAFFACGAASGGGAVPNVQGVGQKGTLPSGCTLEYPIQGAKLNIAGVSCEGWGVMNEIGPEQSYFVRVGGAPDVISFGPFPAEDSCELYTVRLA